ncbi:MAG TPA: hypothetical protein VHO29_10065 [Marmoricola sp.]|nr:hypothetical protein [Marmoricola sp.]
MRTKTPSKKTLTDQAGQLVEQVTPHVEAARERIVNDYLPVAQTVLADARETAVELAKDARQAAQEAAVNAEKSTRKSRKKAAKNAKAKAKSLAAAAAATPAAAAVAQKIKPEQKKSKGKRRFLFLLALVGAGAAVFKKLQGGGSSATTSYTPPAPRSVPDPVATTPPAPPEMHFEPDPTDAGPGTDVEGTTDAGGAFLDEVAADADEQPHPVTTPDQPADVQDVSKKS